MGDTLRPDIRIRTKTDMGWSMDVCQDQFHRMPLNRCLRMDVVKLLPLPGSDILESVDLVGMTHVPRALYLFILTLLSVHICPIQWALPLCLLS